jgi:signal transduction histidine kinase
VTQTDGPLGVTLPTPTSATLSARLVRYVAGVVLIAAGYYAAAQRGEALLLTGPAGAFWPATGVGIAVLYLGGLRWWPGVLLGDLLSREFAQLPLGTALAESAGNIARALVAVVILRRMVGRHAAMDRVEHVTAVPVAVAVGEAVSATVAMLALRRGDILEASEMEVFWRSWWLGGLAGGLVVVPLALAWAHPQWSAWRGRGAVEGALILATVAGLSAIALSAEQPLTYLVFPAFIWAALRFGPQGATLAVAVAAVIAVWGTSNKLGPFVEQAPTDSALNLQLYITFAALTTFYLAAFVSERRRAALELADSQRREGERAAQERHRIARDLHDSVSQSLFSTVLHVRSAQRALEQDESNSTEQVGTELAEIGQLSRSALSEMRALILELQPEALADKGLVGALTEQALALSTRGRAADRGRGSRRAPAAGPGSRGASVPPRPGGVGQRDQTRPRKQSRCTRCSDRRDGFPRGARRRQRLRSRIRAQWTFRPAIDARPRCGPRRSIRTDEHARQRHCRARRGAVPVMMANSDRIRILVVDDHAVVRRGLSGFLDGEPDLEIVGEAEGGGRHWTSWHISTPRGCGRTWSSWTSRWRRLTASSRPGRSALGTATWRWWR